MITSLLKRKWGLLFFALAVLTTSSFPSRANLSRSILNSANFTTSTNPGSDEFNSLKNNSALKFEVRGTVSDSLGPMPGVSISIKGSPNINTLSDANGKYVISAPDENATLVFKMLGYNTLEIPIRGKSVVNALIKPSSQVLEEAVVVAFGTQKKESVVSSITTIRPSELKVPSSNLTTALAGRLAGVIAYQRSGEPGRDNAEFFIRGATTFGYKQDPLILIDNMEYTTTDLARLTVDDIEAFSILKDASANALYGARGANGVILITTKQGKAGKPKINLRFENSISSPTRNIEFADPVTFMKLHNESFVTRKPNVATPYLQSKIDKTEAGANPTIYPAVDWHNMLLKDQVMNQRFNFNLGGGGQVATYYVAGAVNQDNGILKVDRRNNFNSNINLKSFNLRSNVELNVSKSTKVGVRLNGNFDAYKGPLDGGKGIYEKIVRTSPVLFQPYYTVEKNNGGTNKHIMFGNFGGGEYLNPYADMVKGYKEESRSLMVAQVELKQDLGSITPGLSLNAMTNVNRTSFFDVRRSYNPFLYNAGSYDKLSDTYKLVPLNPDGGTDFLSYSRSMPEIAAVFHFQSALNYTRTFKDKHTFGGTAVMIMSSRLDGEGFSLQESLPARNFGISGRATYGFDSRYFAEFNFGYNGSERFHESERFGFFPSAGVAWQISNEKFFEPYASVLSKLKVRANYGLVGNDAIGSKYERFFYLSDVVMNSGTYSAVFGTNNGYSRPGISVFRYENPEITWETAANSTFGLEVGLWNKLDIIAEYFRESRYNILMSRASIPETLGLQGETPKANVGKAKSRSYELQLNYNDAISKNLTVSLRSNITYARNRYNAFEEPAYAQPWLYRVGHSTSQRWGFIAERLFVDDEEVRSSPNQNFGATPTMGGDIKFRDVNGDGEITDLDRVPIGSPTRPEIVYGFGPAVRFKNFDFNFFIQGAARTSFWIDPVKTAPFITGTESGGMRYQTQMLKAYAENHWSEQNRDLYALWPRLSSDLHQNNIQQSTWFMRNGAFIRLKQIDMGFTLPARLVKKLRMENLRLYGTATNILTISKFKLWDVEMGGEGLGYPVQRTINFGLQAGF
jgi:TonB-linked SusC/RagA family outer membrane protein